jgi:YidC/Oxa1 family membrane protein insertase
LPEIRNPNLESQGSGGASGGDFRSLILFTFLALAVLLVYQYFKMPEPNQPAQQNQQAQQQRATHASQSTAAPGGKSSSSSLAAMAPAASVSAAAETTTTLENEKFRITFSNKGAQVQHWILKNYTDSTGKPLDIVQQETASRFGFPLSLYTYDSGLTQQLNSALYRASATGTLLGPNSVTFQYAAGGLDVVKTITFNTTYVVSVHVQVKRDGLPVRALVAWPASLGDMEEFLTAAGKHTTFAVPTGSQLAWSVEGKQDTEASKKVSGDATFDQPYEYAALMDLYFAAAFLPSAPQHATMVTFHHTIELPSDLSDPNSQKKPEDVIGLAMGDQSGDTQVRVYAGPKETDILNSVRAIGADGQASGEPLSSLIQYGWWGIIAKPLYLALRGLHNMMGPGLNNWGWAIIIVTVIFNLVLLPTRIWTMKSSLKMMRIQPKVDALKKRYAHLKVNDPKKAEMNAEMVQLYKEEGVNMYGGCLPMLLQMPLFFAYYRVLQNAVELRQAHWFWLHDLAMPDPLHLLPLLIIGTMFLVQFITPAPGMDPMQRRMMAIMMPAIMGFTLWHFASGLALYWITGNIINLIMQVAINNSKIGKEMHEIAARRAAKKAAGGKGGNVNQKVIQGRR